MSIMLVFRLTSFGTLKYDCLIKAREIFNFLPLIKKSVTVPLSFSLLCISAMISSKIIEIYRFLFGLYSIKVFESFKYFKPVLSLFLIKNWTFASDGSFTYIKDLSIFSPWFIRLSNAIVFFQAPKIRF